MKALDVIVHTSPWPACASQAQQVSRPCQGHASSSPWVHAHPSPTPPLLTLIPPEHTHPPATNEEWRNQGANKAYALVNTLSSHPESFGFRKEDEVSTAPATKWHRLGDSGQKWDWWSLKDEWLAHKYPKDGPELSWLCALCLPWAGRSQKSPSSQLLEIENHKREAILKM